MEELRIKGIIEEAVVKSGNTNGKDWERCVVKVGGKIFASFDQAYVKDIKDDVIKYGIPIEMVYTTDGKYNTIVSIEPDLNAPIPPIKPASEQKSDEVDWEGIARGKVRSLFIQARINKSGLSKLTAEEKEALKELEEIAMTGRGIGEVKVEKF